MLNLFGPLATMSVCQVQVTLISLVSIPVLVFVTVGTNRCLLILTDLVLIVLKVSRLRVTRNGFTLGLVWPWDWSGCWFLRLLVLSKFEFLVACACLGLGLATLATFFWAYFSVLGLVSVWALILQFCDARSASLLITSYFGISGVSDERCLLDC